MAGRCRRIAPAGSSGPDTLSKASLAAAAPSALAGEAGKGGGRRPSAALPDESRHPHAGRSARACGGRGLEPSSGRRGARRDALRDLARVLASPPVREGHYGPCSCLRDTWPRRLRLVGATALWQGHPGPEKNDV